MRGAALAPLLRARRPAQKALKHVRYATTSMRMPAMSPTMTEGGITGWKKQEGESFAAGDVLLEVETDKATIDVEAQDDGVMGKILSDAGSSKIPVGQVIAILAEEGDDLAAIEVPSNLSPPGEGEGAKEVPKAEMKPAEAEAPKSKEKKAEGKEESRTESKSQPEAASGGKKEGHKVVKHAKPLFPSVLRLLQESDLSSEQISKLKGTGKYGMLTKGDVLVALGKIKNPYGSAEKLVTDALGASGKRASEATTTSATQPAKKEEPLDGPALRRLILQGMSRATEPPKAIVPQSEDDSDRATGARDDLPVEDAESLASSPLPLSPDAAFDDIIAPYASLLPQTQPAVVLPGREALAAMDSRGMRGKEDEWAGLY